MRLSSLFGYRGSATAIIYRDGGSLELRYVANDNNGYYVLMEVVQDSSDNCKRYQPPVLLKDSFDINNSKPEDFISYLTWEQVKSLIDEIKIDIGPDFQKRSDSPYFDLIKNIADNSGWLIK